jgi:hypothetical protein
MASIRAYALAAAAGNAAILALVTPHFNRPASGAYIAALGFWFVLAIFPSIIRRGDPVRPSAFVLFMFFFTMVIAPPALLYYEPQRAYVLMPQPAFWHYAEITSLFWVLALLCFCAAAFPRRREGRGKLEEAPWAKPAASRWMPLAGLFLMAVGAVGVSMAAGSLGAALAAGGTRQLAQELFNQPGTYRYLLWLEAAPVGACLVWWYCVRRLKLGGFGGFIAALAVYLPMLPFYMYSAGRARALVPFLLLLVVFHRFHRPIKLRWAAVGLALMIPLLGVWAEYRIKSETIRVASDYAIATVMLADLSRYDVSIRAVAGFHEGRMQHLYGETLAAAALHPLPRSLAPHDFTGGTAAMAKAFHGDSEYDLPSSFATPLLVEGYLNFGIAGIVMFFLLFGWLIRWLDRLYDSVDLLVVLFSFMVVLKSPFGVSLEISVSLILWAAVFPWVVASVARAQLVAAGRARVPGSAHPSGQMPPSLSSPAT